jgi:hypothetical protein
MGQRKPAKIIHNLEVDGVGDVVLGLRVEHPKFGAGEIEELYELEDGSNTIRVNFDSFGSKALVPEYANLTRESKANTEFSSSSVFSKIKSLFK